MKEKMIEINGQFLYVQYCLQKLDTPTLVFLHDAWGCTEMWGDFPRMLATQIETNYVIYDRAGHGKSSVVHIDRRNTTFFEDEAAVLIQLLDKLDIVKVVLVGHSDGATIALVAASVYPNRIQSLILESAHTCTEPEGIKQVVHIAQQSQGTHLLASLQKFHGANIPNLFNYWVRMWTDERFLHWDVISHIQKITCPIIAFRGCNDLFDTVKQNTLMAHNTKGKIIMTLIVDAGHTPHKDNPVDVISFISKYWEKYGTYD